jgi:hypothetical protein
VLEIKSRTTPAEGYTAGRSQKLPPAGWSFIDLPPPFAYIFSMQISPSVASLLAHLDAFSGHRLRVRDDLAVVLELGATEGNRTVLADVCFRAKFLTKTFGIMQRIGPRGEGYERLASEFAHTLEESRAMLQTLLAGAPVADRERFAAAYLALTPEAFGSTLALLHDLAWYKNWLLDNP